MSKKCRLIFSKTGKAQYISHLDLMHAFQRSFVRAGIMLRHSEGFNPHPYMSIILPLSVGQESVCEVMDIELLHDDEDIDGILLKINDVLPEGIEAIGCCEPVMKAKELTWLRVHCELIYDGGVSEEFCSALSDFYGKDEIVIDKKSKRGISKTDIRPMIYSAEFAVSGKNVIVLDAVLAAQNPSLNPSAMLSALEQLKPELKPDFCKIMRRAVYNADMKEFE